MKTADSKREAVWLGPFLNRWSGAWVETPEVERTGYALEFASPGRGESIPIYHRLDGGQWFYGRADYLFHQKDAPLDDMVYRRQEAIASKAGLFVSLESLLVTLYEEHSVARPITSFLGEMSEALPLWQQASFLGGRLRVAFKPEITALGFYLVYICGLGPYVLAHSAWVSPQARKDLASAQFYPAGGMLFGLEPDGTLSPGRWQPPIPGFLVGPLWQALRAVCPAAPRNAFSEEGKQLLLAAFQGTPRACSRHRSNRQARVAFVQQHPELLDRPRELAAAMREAQLYSQRTAIGQIVRHLGSLIAKAKGNGM